MQLLKKIGKKILPQWAIYFYHSLRFSRKLGITWPLLRSLGNWRRKVRLGGEAGWTIPRTLLNEASVCYCIGCGEDITFDLELIRTYGCTVYAFDPTPRAIAHVAAHTHGIPEYRFAEVAIWDKEDTVRFYVPGEEHGVSHSITNLDSTTEYIEVPTKRLRQVFQSNGHASIALLKMDIEGAEHTVIQTVVEDALAIDVLCIEFDELAKYATPERVAKIRGSIQSLLDHGYDYFWIEGSNFTFVRRDLTTRTTQ